jgi:hypothetical protein
MKKISLTLRIPIFVDIDVEINDRDFEDLIEEWDESNFGIVKGIVEKYIDLDNVSAEGSQERFGETEIVDLGLFEEEVKLKVGVLPAGVNTIIPKGKPN